MANDMTELKYQRARNLIDKNDEKSIYEARTILEQLDDYKDSKKYLNDCILKINQYEIEHEEKIKEDYAKACELMKDKKSAYKLDTAIKIFKSLGDYEDSVSRLEVCNELRCNVSKKDKKGLSKIKIAGFVVIGISILFIAFIIFAAIWQSIVNE